MCCDGRVVKASDSKSDGVTRTGSNPVRSEFFLIFNPVFLYFIVKSHLDRYPKKTNQTVRTRVSTSYTS